MSGSDPAEAVARALSFLKAAQQPDGGFLNQFQYADQDPILVANVFPAALIAHCLSFSPAGRSVTERALDFLAAEASKEGVWSHFSSSQLDQEFLPPDVDDTACASAALRQGCRPVPDNEALMLANRDRRGLFYTWFTFRPRWSGLAHWRLVWPQPVADGGGGQQLGPAAGCGLCLVEQRTNKRRQGAAGRVAFEQGEPFLGRDDAVSAVGRQNAANKGVEIAACNPFGDQGENGAAIIFDLEVLPLCG